MIFPRWKKVAIGDGCLKSSQSFNLHKIQSITLVRFKSLIASKESLQTIKYFLIFVMIFMFAQSTFARVFEYVASLSPSFYVIGILFWLVQRIERLNKRQDNKITRLDNKITRLDRTQGERFDNLHAEIRGTPGKETAKEFTIAIIARREYNHNDNMVIGHGSLLLCAEQDHYGILTAAHVVNDMLAFKATWKLEIETLSGGHNYKIDEDSPLEKFVSPHYVRRGRHDCGVMVVKLKNGPTRDMFKQLVLSQDHPFDNEFVGLSKNFRFRGEAFTHFGRWRVGLGIPSKPGCSGTPFFCPRGRILAVLHGEWKHRGQRHSGGMDKGLSNHVYVDRVLNLNDLRFWADSYNECFVCLEDIADEDGTGTTKLLLKPPLEAPEAASDDDLSEEEAPEAAAWKFYEAAKRALPAEFVVQQPCFRTRETHFRVIDVCNALIKYHKENTGDAPELRERLISPGEHMYLALSIRP